MKLAKPITIEVTEQRVVGLPNFDRASGVIRIPIIFYTSEGVQAFQGEAVLQEVTKVTETDGDGKETTSFKGGNCQRMVANPQPVGLLGLFITETFQSQTAYQNARVAIKQEDEIAALELAGIADGWLIG